jgi:hypothetical protein
LGCVPPAQSSRLCSHSGRPGPSRDADRCADRRVSGTHGDGAGVVIDDAGLVVTIGYLITEA